MKKTFFLKKIFILMLILLGFFLRSQEALSHNFLFLLDQGRDMLAVKHIIYDHHLTLLGPYTSLQGVFQGPLWYYLLAVPTVLLNGDPWGGVLLVLFISLTTMVLAAYFLGKTFGTSAGFVALFLFAISPQAIAAATFAWNPHPMWLLVFCFVMFLYQVVLGKVKYHPVLWLCLGLMFHFESALAVFLLFSAGVYLLIFKRSSLKNKYFFYGLLLLFLTFLPQILFDLRYHFLMTKSIFKVISGSSQGLTTSHEKSPFVKNISDHFSAFTTNFTGAFVMDRRYPYIGSMAFVTACFSYVYFLLKKKISQNEKEFLFMCLLLIVLVFLLTLLYPFPLRSWFLTGFEVLFLLPVSVLFSKLFHVRYANIILVFFFCLMSIVSLQKLYFLYKFPDYGGVAKVKGKLDAIDFIYHDVRSATFSLFIFTPPVYTDAYDYLLFWRSKTRYHYVPGKKKNGTFYLLIEPDPSKPWSYKGWEETVIKSGKVLWTKMLPSGLIIEKRVGNET